MVNLNCGGKISHETKNVQYRGEGKPGYGGALEALGKKDESRIGSQSSGSRGQKGSSLTGKANDGKKLGKKVEGMGKSL